mmetsp:Transcript_7907/g.17152  ORF Transcript_7907/g.17152 Transcript_7907/m.17152 type:complete len:133 (+) Transcript_7907:139-537(+)
MFSLFYNAAQLASANLILIEVLSFCGGAGLCSIVSNIQFSGVAYFHKLPQTQSNIALKRLGDKVFSFGLDALKFINGIRYHRLEQRAFILLYGYHTSWCQLFFLKFNRPFAQPEHFSLDHQYCLGLWNIRYW